MGAKRKMERKNIKEQLKNARENERHWKKAWERGKVLAMKAARERDAFNEEVKTLSARLDAAYRMLTYLVQEKGGKAIIPKEGIEESVPFSLEFEDNNIVFEIKEEE